MVDVRVICAIGKHGKLGLNGRLPGRAILEPNTKPTSNDGHFMLQTSKS